VEAFSRRPFLVAVGTFFVVAFLGIAVGQRTPSFFVAIVVALAVGTALSAPAERAFVVASLVGVVVGGAFGRVFGGLLDALAVAPPPGRVPYWAFNPFGRVLGWIFGLLAVQEWFARRGALPGNGKRSQGRE